MTTTPTLPKEIEDIFAIANKLGTPMVVRVFASALENPIRAIAERNKELERILSQERHEFHSQLTSVNNHVKQLREALEFVEFVCHPEEGFDLCPCCGRTKHIPECRLHAALAATEIKL